MRRTLIILALAVVLIPSVAYAQFAVSGGIDVGVTRYHTNVELLERGPSTQRGHGISLGLEMLNAMWVLESGFMVGAALEGSLFVAGPEPSPALEFLLGPRVGWQRNRFHVQASGGFLLSAFDDRCSGEFTVEIDCPDTRPSEPVGTGFGFTLSPMFRIPFDGVGIHLGPTLRYRNATIDYEDGADHFFVRTWQLAFAAHFMWLPD